MVKKLFLFFFLSSTCLYGNIVEEGIKKLSLNERMCMKAFFEEALLHDQATHVLFFNKKPICLTGPVIQHSDRNHRDVLCLKGWRAFKKHEHLFPHPNFIFNEHLFDGGRECKVLDIYIINKVSLEKCLAEYKKAFQEVLGESFSPKQFIADLEKGTALPDLLLGDEMLLGILLGYGEESSRAYKKGCGQEPTETYRRIDLRCPQGCKINPVVFMGNPRSSEVKQLSSVYEDELEKIWPRYKAEGSLVLFLKGICEE